MKKEKKKMETVKIIKELSELNSAIGGGESSFLLEVVDSVRDNDRTENRHNVINLIEQRYKGSADNKYCLYALLCLMVADWPGAKDCFRKLLFPFAGGKQ